MVRRIYVEKKQGFDVEAAGLFRSMKDDLHLQSVTGLRILNRYDIDGIDDETYEAAKFTVFAEPAIDSLYEEELPGDISSANFLEWNSFLDSMTREQTPLHSVSA